MRLNVCVWGRKVCDDLASKRDTESVSSERSHKITGSLMSHLDVSSSDV